MNGDHAEGKIEFEAKIGHRRHGRLGEEFDDAWNLRQDRLGCGTGTMISESGQGEVPATAKLGLAQVAAVEGVEDLAPLSGSAVAGHPELSPELWKAVDGPDRTLTVKRAECESFQFVEIEFAAPVEPLLVIQFSIGLSILVENERSLPLAVQIRSMVYGIKSSSNLKNS